MESERVHSFNFLWTLVSSDNLTWRANTTAGGSAALSPPQATEEEVSGWKLLVAVHRSAAESVPVHRVAERHTGCSVADRKISGCHLHSLEEILVTLCLTCRSLKTEIKRRFVSRISCCSRPRHTFFTITLRKNTINEWTPSGDAPINRRLMNVGRHSVIS